MLEELLLLEELLFSPTRDCDISIFWLEGGRSYVDGLEDELLSRVGSIGRILEAERLKTAGSLSRHFVGENLAQSAHPE